MGKIILTKTTNYDQVIHDLKEKFNGKLGDIVIKSNTDGKVRNSILNIRVSDFDVQDTSDRGMGIQMSLSIGESTYVECYFYESSEMSFSDKYLIIVSDLDSYILEFEGE